MIDRLRPTLSEWERGNFDAGAEILTPDVLLSGLVADGMVTSRGFDEMAAVLRDFFGQWANYRIEVDELTELDDSHVVMEGRQDAMGKQSGIEISESLVTVFGFRGDRVSEMHPPLNTGPSGLRMMVELRDDALAALEDEVADE